MPAREDREPWHLDKKVPIALIITIVAQGLALVVWAAKMDGRVETVERHVTETRDDGSRLARLEVFRDDLGRRLDRIEAKLDRLVEHGGGGR